MHLIWRLLLCFLVPCWEPDKINWLLVHRAILLEEGNVATLSSATMRTPNGSNITLAIPYARISSPTSVLLSSSTYVFRGSLCTASMASRSFPDKQQILKLSLQISSLYLARCPVVSFTSNTHCRSWQAVLTMKWEPSINGPGMRTGHTTAEIFLCSVIPSFCVIKWPWPVGDRPQNYVISFR